MLLGGNSEKSQNDGLYCIFFSAPLITCNQLQTKQPKTMKRGCPFWKLLHKSVLQLRTSIKSLTFQDKHSFQDEVWLDPHLCAHVVAVNGVRCKCPNQACSNQGFQNEKSKKHLCVGMYRITL